MDSYNRKDEKPASGAPSGPLGRQARPGTGNLSLDSFQSSGTAPLGRMGTKRLASGPMEAEKTVQAMTTEIENGTVIVEKLSGRIAVLSRAFQIADKPIDANKILAGIGSGEANFTKQVAQSLIQDPGAKRRVQVAVYQFEQAQKGIQQARELLERANQYEGTARVQFVDNQLQVEKLRGQLYPLINLHMVFREHALISQLIPTPKIQTEEELPPPPPPPEPQAPATGAAALAGDPAVAQMVDSFQKMTGRLSGLFKKKQ